MPLIFESKKSRGITRFLTVIDGIWMWASLMFLMDIVFIYIVARFISLPFEIILILLMIVPVLGIYNYRKGHNLVVHEKTIELANLERDISIAHLSDIHFGSLCHRKIIQDIADRLNDIDCDLAIISGDLADGTSVVEPDDFMAFRNVGMPVVFTPGNHDFYMEIDDVIAACIDCMKKCADSPCGFMLNTGCQLPIGTPKRNVEAFIYAARKYGRGAKMGQLPKGLEDV
jgi:hypothetical protein